jgi:putative ABC transport system permease protein
MLIDLSRDVRYAWRLLRRQAGFSAVTVSTRARLALAGVAIGVVVAAGLARAIRSELFGVTAADPATLAAAAAILVAVALVATFLPARRATRIDPMQAVRAE